MCNFINARKMCNLHRLTPSIKIECYKIIRMFFDFFYYLPNTFPLGLI